MVGQAPLGHDRTAARHDAGYPLGGEGHIAQEHAGVDGEVVDPLLGLLAQGLEKDLDVEILDLTFDLLERLVDGDGADGHGRVAHHPFARLVDVRPRRQIHDGIRSPTYRPAQLVHFLAHTRADGRVADVGIHLDQEVAADHHGLGFGMLAVSRDDGAPARYLGAHHFGRDVFAQGHETHLLGDLALAGTRELRAVAAAPAVEPRLAQLGQPLTGRFHPGSRGVVDLEGGLVATQAQRAHRNLDLSVTLERAGRGRKVRGVGRRRRLLLHAWGTFPRQR